MQPPTCIENPEARTSFVSGIVALVAVFLPPGLLVAPLAGIGAVVFGLLGRRRARAGAADADKALAGIVLGTIALLATAIVVYLLRHVIGDALDDIDAF
jgi:hypothetical protein